MQGKYCNMLCNILLLMSHLALADNACCESHHFVPRSITSDLTYTNMLNAYARNHSERDKFTYSGTFSYQRSNKSDRLGSAFLLKDNCNCINVKRLSDGKNPPTDVNSLWLGLFNKSADTEKFSSQFCVEPQRSAFAYSSYLYGNLSRLLEGLWLDVAFSVLSVTHRMHCCENGKPATGKLSTKGFATVSCALESPLLCFGKFNCGECNDKHRAGVDDVQVRLGYQRGWSEDRHFAGLYFMGTIPTGRRPDAKYIFEPLVGSRHGSVGIGLNADLHLWSNDEERNLSLLFDTNYRYVFKGSECRSFDLCKNGPFSRHLLVVKEADRAAPTPGINFFTQNVDVTPRSTVQLLLSLHYQHDLYDVEVGYNFYWRQQEEIDCLTCFPENIGIFDLGCFTCISASTAIISQGTGQFKSDLAFVALKASDLNLVSGAADSALSNKFYGIVSRSGDAGDCMDWRFALGGSYEFVTGGDYKCSTLPYWTVFGQFSLLF